MNEQCFVCKKEVDKKEFENGQAIMLDGPNIEMVVVHTRHNGIMAEYDEQLDKKECRT